VKSLTVTGGIRSTKERKMAKVKRIGEKPTNCPSSNFYIRIKTLFKTIFCHLTIIKATII
jgi:hypothetical protein